MRPAFRRFFTIALSLIGAFSVAMLGLADYLEQSMWLHKGDLVMFVAPVDGSKPVWQGPYRIQEVVVSEPQVILENKSGPPITIPYSDAIPLELYRETHK